MASATVDLGSGELTDEPQIRPFAELMTMLDHGSVHAEASRALHDLTAAVRDTGKAGTLTIALKLAPLKGNVDQLVIGAQVTAKPPKSEPTSAMFYVDDEGNLTRHDPRQLELDGLRVVEPKATKTINI